MDHNGSSMGLALILGELRAESRHQTQILIDIKDELEDLPSRLSTLIVTEEPKATLGILKAIPPILKALVPILTIVGLMTGKIAWTDIPGLLGH